VRRRKIHRYKFADAGTNDIISDCRNRANNVRDVHDRVATGCCTAMWKAYATRETVNVKRNIEARL